MTTAEKFAEKYKLARGNELELDRVMQSIRDARVYTPDVPGRDNEGDGVVHVFKDDSWFDDKTQEVGYPIGRFYTRSDGSLGVTYS